MSYYPSQAYSSYQTPYNAYSNQSTSYPSPNYSSQVPAGLPSYPSSQVKAPSPPPKTSSAPDLSAVTPEIASHVIQRLLSSELRYAGFDSAQPYALQRLEHEVIALVEKLYQFAHDYANHANRARPVATDVLLACKRYGVEPNEMHEVAVSSKKRKRENIEPEILVLLPPPSRSPSPELLPSDDEETVPVVPATLRTLPHHLPALPPKHTYLRTPASPPKKAALPSLEKKLKTASLVQESLKNLLLATEDSTGQEDGELLGAIVNWETTTHPRKRWKLSS